MKRLSIEKLQLILNDYKANNIEDMSSREMDELYEKFGDEYYYGKGGYDASSKKGKEYIELKDRK